MLKKIFEIKHSMLPYAKDIAGHWVYNNGLAFEISAFTMLKHTNVQRIGTS